MPNTCHHGTFIFKTLNPLRLFAECVIEHLECYGAVQRHIQRTVHHTHATYTDDALQPEIAQLHVDPVHVITPRTNHFRIQAKPGYVHVRSALWAHPYLIPLGHLVRLPPKTIISSSVRVAKPP